MFLASWRVDRVGVVLPGGDLERRSASAWRNKSALLPLPVRRRRVVGSVVWPADGSCLFGAPRSADLRGFASELFADLLSPAGRGGEGRRSLVWQLCFVLVFVVFFGGSPLSGRGGKGRDPLEVLLVRLVVLLRARHGGGVGHVPWSSRPRACLPTWCRFLQRRRGALRYVGGLWVTPRPVQVCWSKVGRSSLDAPSWWCWCLDLREGRRCSFSVLDSGALRRMALVFEAWWSSPAVVSGWFDFVSSGDGVGGVGALGRVVHLSVFALLYVMFSVFCIS